MYDFIIGLFLASVVAAIIQFFMLKKKSYEIDYAENQAKIQELKGYLEDGKTNLVDSEGRNILMIAMSEPFFARRKDWSFTDVGKLAVEKGLGIDSVNPANGWTALFYALNSGRNSDVPWLLEKGADPNHLDIRGRNALFEAIESESILRQELLLIMDGIRDLDYQKKDGFTALMVAASNMRVWVIHELLSRGVNPNLVHEKGKNAYEIARSVKSKYYKHSSNSAKPDEYGKHNHGIDEAVRHLEYAIMGKKFKKKRYRSSSSGESYDAE